jgi:mRNA-degrading endonuclease RelE of RelBE toxin-antitoxin system
LKYNITYTPLFYSKIKKYNKRFKSTLKDIAPLIENLENGIFDGDKIEGACINKNEIVYKVRIGIKSIPVGKSGGYRVIYYIVKKENDIYMLDIYFKGDKENITNNEIIETIKKYCS